MPSPVVFVGERSGARIFTLGRIGYDSAGDDLGSHTYTATARTERIFPGGPGALINFRRVVVHILADSTYSITIKVWVDGNRTTDGAGSTQTVTIAGGSGSLSEHTEEAAIEAEGSLIQVEVTVSSDSPTGLFLIEAINARGRVVRRGATRSSEVT